MNKFRLNHIVQILLLPYHEMEFYSEGKDRIAALAEAYYQASHAPMTLINKRIECENNYIRAEKELEEYLRNNTSLQMKSIDDTKMIMELFFPQTGIADFKERHNIGKNNSFSEFVCGYYLLVIFYIAESLLTFRDGKIAIRTWINKEEDYGRRDLFDYHGTFDKVEIWNTLSRLVVPDIFIAAFFITADLSQRKYLYNQNGGIFLADKTLDHILKHGIAETHMHFNAGLEYTTLWKFVTNPLQWEQYFCQKVKWHSSVQSGMLFQCVIFRLLFASYLEKVRIHQCEPCSLLEFVESEYPENASDIFELFEDIHKGKTKELLYYKSFYSTILRHVKAQYPEMNSEEDFLFQSVYKNEQYLKTVSEMIFLTEVLQYLKSYGDFYAIRLFIQYIRVKNNYFKEILQSNNLYGLGNFQKYYSSAMNAAWAGAGKNPEMLYREIFKSQSHNTNLKKLEIRITPEFRVEAGEKGLDYRVIERELKLGILKRVRMIFDEYVKYACDMVNADIERRTLTREQFEEMDDMYFKGICGFPSVGVLFHFQKRDFLDNRLGDMCWVKYVEKIPTYSKYLLIWRKQMVNCAMAIEELRSEIPGLGEYIVGIDAASDECSTEPWILAPVYAGIRNRKVTKPLLLNEDMTFSRIPNIGFTYHVGEEFRHLLSGFRHIDEVIEHFHYKAGDRLGHAIALGEDVEFWIRENEVITIPIMEQLENLIWLWGNMVNGKLEIKMMVEELEGRIMVLSKRIFDNILGLTPFMLYEAYQEKFKKNHDYIFDECKKYLSSSDELKDGNSEGHFCKFYDVKNNGLGYMWTKEKLLCTYYCPHYALKFRQPVFIEVKENEKQLLLEIQRQLSKKVETKGIYVETNPTSNTAVGQINGLFSHYIMNLNSSGLKAEEECRAILVTINSDDPIVFNTNVENELAYIYHALVHKGYKKEHVLHWIDKVRQFGLDSSFVKKEKRPSIQIKEMCQMLDLIDNYIKNGK